MAGTTFQYTLLGSPFANKNARTEFENHLEVIAGALWHDDRLRSSFYCIWIGVFDHGAMTQLQHRQFELAFDHFLRTALPVIRVLPLHDTVWGFTPRPELPAGATAATSAPAAAATVSESVYISAKLVRHLYRLDPDDDRGPYWRLFFLLVATILHEVAHRFQLHLRPEHSPLNLAPQGMRGRYRRADGTVVECGEAGFSQQYKAWGGRCAGTWPRLRGMKEIERVEVEVAPDQWRVVDDRWLEGFLDSLITRTTSLPRLRNGPAPTPSFFYQVRRRVASDLSDDAPILAEPTSPPIADAAADDEPSQLDRILPRCGVRTSFEDEFLELDANSGLA